MRKTALNTVYEVAKKNKKVLFIGSDLGHGVLEKMKKEIPDRFFMEGVCEQGIIGMSAGLAMEGFIPYVNTIGTFITRRCYEQIVLDLCLHKLPVRLIGNGGGAVYAPLGPTHLAIDDLAILKVLPNMTIICPCDAIEMKKAITKSVDWTGPIYIRLARGGDEIITSQNSNFEIGKAVVLKEPKDGLFITTGVMAQIAKKAIKKLDEDGYKIGLLHFHTIKPLDEKILKNLIPKVKSVVTVEEHSKIGGLGSAVLEYLSDQMPNETNKITRIGIPDRFAEQYGTQDSLLDYWKINTDNLYETMKNKLNK